MSSHYILYGVAGSLNFTVVRNRRFRPVLAAAEAALFFRRHLDTYIDKPVNLMQVMEGDK